MTSSQPQSMNKPRQTMYYAGLASCLIFSIAYVIAHISVYLRLPLGFSPLLALAIVFCIYKFHLQRTRSFIISIVSIIIFTLISAFFYDLSSDGRVHFMEEILQIANGYVPGDTFPVDPGWWGTPWASGYPLGQQIYNAAVYCFTGSLQSAKSITLILLFAAVTMSYPFFYNATRGPKTSLLLAVLVVCNPVVLGHLFSFYIDGDIYLLFLCALCSLAYMHEDGQNTLNLFFVILAMCIFPSIKMSGIAFSLLILPFLAVSKHTIKRSAILLLFLLPCILCLLYHPYLHVSIADQLGLIKLGANPPAHGLHEFSVLRYIQNLFSTPTPAYRRVGFAFNPFEGELRHTSSFGLYGISYAALLLLCLYVLIKNKKIDKTVLYFLFISIAVPMLYPSFINQRYYPIPYLLVFFLIAYLYPKITQNTTVKNILVFLLVTHSLYLGLIFKELAGHNIRETRRINKALKQVAKSLHDIVYIDFNTKDEGSYWSAEALSDRTWMKNIDKDVYFPTHIINRHMLRKRLEKATFLASYGRKSRNETPTPLGNLRDGQVIDLQGTRNTCKALIVKARLPFAPIAFNVLISDHEYFPKPTFSNSFQRAMNLSGEAIVFELPPYTQMVRINSYPINITEYEITVVELDPPIYHNFSKKNEINNYTSKSKDISPEEKSVDKIIGDGFVPRQKPTMDWFGSKINLSTF